MVSGNNYWRRSAFKVFSENKGQWKNTCPTGLLAGRTGRVFLLCMCVCVSLGIPCVSVCVYEYLCICVFFFDALFESPTYHLCYSIPARIWGSLPLKPPPHTTTQRKPLWPLQYLVTTSQAIEGVILQNARTI